MTTSILHNSLLMDTNKTQTVCDDLVNEEALQMIINGQDFSITMQTPGHELYLVRGLLHAESIHSKPFLDFKLERHDIGSVARIQIQNDKNLSSGRRLNSTASCGICGKRNIEDLFEHLLPVERHCSVNSMLITRAFQNAQKKQALFTQTGGSHAASAANEHGETLCLFEDIGRHNAVDKVIGYLLENDLLTKACILTVSGRISFEIIQKCNRAGIPVLASISAPSSLAVKYAQDTGITLAAFCREQRATFYSGFHRLSNNSNQD